MRVLCYVCCRQLYQFLEIFGDYFPGDPSSPYYILEMMYPRRRIFLVKIWMTEITSDDDDEEQESIIYCSSPVRSRSPAGSECSRDSRKNVKELNEEDIITNNKNINNNNKKKYFRLGESSKIERNCCDTIDDIEYLGTHTVSLTFEISYFSILIFFLSSSSIHIKTYFFVSRVRNNNNGCR